MEDGTDLDEKTATWTNTGMDNVDTDKADEVVGTITIPQEQPGTTPVVVNAVSSWSLIFLNGMILLSSLSTKQLNDISVVRRKQKAETNNKHP